MALKVQEGDARPNGQRCCYEIQKFEKKNKIIQCPFCFIKIIGNKK